ncbi:hypothetical protein BC826DRAFT_525345 [Russula brevipes]|nr:hypothetical protein BC826DRAFT_525345 [Russula brevipes]
MPDVNGPPFWPALPICLLHAFHSSSSPTRVCLIRRFIFIDYSGRAILRQFHEDALARLTLRVAIRLSHWHSHTIFHSSSTRLHPWISPFLTPFPCLARQYPLARLGMDVSSRARVGVARQKKLSCLVYWRGRIDTQAIPEGWRRRTAPIYNFEKHLPTGLRTRS